MGFVVVLARTHSPGNLGSSSRAAKAFGARLALLDPRADRSHPDALAFASGAEELLAQAPVLASWDAVAQGSDRVVALTSLRGRNVRGLPPKVTWPSVRADGECGTVVLLFGPERGGLTREEVERCDARLSLPTTPGFPTLNLAQAVAATLALLAAGKPSRRADDVDALAPSADVARLLERLHALLAASGFPGKGRTDAVLPELDSLLKRARPRSREITLLLGALASVERKLGPS
jgi:tRNA/rRNA methyltransferase